MPPATFSLQQSVYDGQTFRNLTTSQSITNRQAVALTSGRYITSLEISGNGAGGAYSSFSITLHEADGTSIPIASGGIVGNLTSGAVFAATADGGFLVSYTSQQYIVAAGSPTPGDIYVSRYDANGALVVPPILVNAVADQLGNQGNTAQTMSYVTALAGGNFVVAYTESADVHYQLFSSSGARIGSDRIANATLNGTQQNPTLTALADGGFLVTWESTTSSAQPPQFDIIGQRFDATGQRVGAEVVINTVTTGVQALASIATLADGKIVAAYLSQGAVKFQLLDAALNKIGGEVTVAASSSDVVVKAYPGGGFVLGWAGSIQVFDNNGAAISSIMSGPGVHFDVLSDGTLRSLTFSSAGQTTYFFAEKYVPTPTAGVTLTGNDAISPSNVPAEQLFGTAFDDTISGLGGNDALYGYEGDDVLSGGDGNDTLYGGDGNDLLIDTLGSDAFVGGAGNDTVSFAGAGAAVVADLAAGVGYGDGFANDGFDSIENLIGSAFNDVLTGNDVANRLEGGPGDDMIITGRGGDTIIGGAGSDTVSYIDSNGTVQVNLTLGRGYNNYADSDTYDGIENVRGSNFNDILIGDGGVNRLEGGDGNDLLIGALGADVLVGGAGIDTVGYEDSIGTVFVNLTLARGYNNSAEGDTYESIENVVGSRFNDVFIGNAGANRLEGMAGDDILIGAMGADILIGGDGIDTASYEDNQGGVFVNLLAGVGSNNAAAGDTYFGIENVTGSIYIDGLLGDAGANRLDGSGGDDILIGGLGADVLIGGSGIDTVSYEDNQGAVIVNLLTGQGFGNAAQGDTYSGIENAVGSVFYDTLIGDNGANRLDGGRGADTLTGNGGADQFVFSTAIDGVINVDHITDFTSGTDKIVLENAIFFGIAEGAFGPNTLILGTAATGGQNRIVYDQATGNLWFDDDGNGSDPAILFAVLDTKPTLTAADFLVI